MAHAHDHDCSPPNASPPHTGHSHHRRSPFAFLPPPFYVSRMQPDYEHRQTGSLALLVIVALAVLPLRHFVYAAAAGEASATTGAAVAALLLLLTAGLVVSGLNTAVDHGHLVWSFGPGFFRQAVALDAIEAVEVVRNPWILGPGIRTRDGVRTWAVAGGPALELRLRDGRRIRIGTDDPEGMVRAIRSAS